MGLTLEQLVEAKTKEQLRDELLLAMQGVGYVAKVGAGEGSLSLSGVAAGEYEVKVKITTPGSLGVAEFRYSLDDGDTYNGADVVVPSGGNYVLTGTGVTLTFENGPGEADQSFLMGDIYSFGLTTPTLPTTSWHAGSLPRTVIEKDAEANEDFAASIQNVAKGGFLSTAEDAWVDLWLEEMYDLERTKGQIAKHTVVLEDVADSGPHNIVAGQLVAATATGLRFSNANGGTLTQGGTLSLTFEAEQRGTAYNVGVGAINVLLTSLPGVTVTNPDLGSGTSITQQGTNRETDDAAKARAKQRWGTLGSGAVEDAYRTWAQEASDNVTRVMVKADPDVAGGVLLVVAGPAGPVDGDTVTAVEEGVEDKVPFGSILAVESAVATAVAISATVYVRAGYGSAALAAIQANLTALFQGGTNSVGEELPGLDISDGTVKVYRVDLIEQMQIPVGVRNIDLATLLPAADTTLADQHVATLSPAPAITIVEV